MKISDQFTPTLHESVKVFLDGTIQIVQEKGSDLFKIFFCDGDKQIDIDVDGKVKEHQYISITHKNLNEGEIQTLINTLQLCLKGKK